MKKLMIIFGLCIVTAESAVISSSGKYYPLDLNTELAMSAGESRAPAVQAAATQAQVPSTLANAYSQAVTELTEQQVALAELIRQAQLKSAAMSASATNQEIEKVRAELEEFNRKAQALSSNIKTTGTKVYNQMLQNNQPAADTATRPCPSSANTQPSLSRQAALLKTQINELKGKISSLESGAVMPGGNPYPRLKQAEEELKRVEDLMKALGQAASALPTHYEYPFPGGTGTPYPV